MDLGRAFLWMAPSGRACLLTWLILVLVAPAPAVLSGGVDRVSGSGVEDGESGCPSPTENETPQDIAPGAVLRRTRGSGRPEAFASCLGSPRETHLCPHSQGQRPGSTHFTDDGRTLRLRLQSLIC